MVILIFLLNRISELTGLYFFSALLQADAAILGILGVFIIFRFQTIQNHIQQLRTLLLDRITPEGTRGAQVHYLSDIIFFERVTLKEKELFVKDRNFGDNHRLFVQWYNQEKEKVKIKNLIRLPVILLGIGLVLNMIFLSIAEIMYYSRIWFILIMVITIAYHIFLFINLVKLIFEAIPPIKEK